MSNCSIYVLKLAQGRYYVGKSSKSVDERFAAHLSGNGSEWTKIYEPIKIIELKENVSPFEEDSTVLRWMSMKGIDNVRGGSYSTIRLSNNTKAEINKKIIGATWTFLSGVWEWGFTGSTPFNPPLKCSFIKQVIDESE